MIAEGETPAGDRRVAAAQVAEHAAAGCTWWLETRWQRPQDPKVRLEEMRERILVGPPHPRG